MTYTVIIVDDEPHAVRTPMARLEWVHLPIQVIDLFDSLNMASGTQVNVRYNVQKKI